MIRECLKRKKYHILFLVIVFTGLYSIDKLLDLLNNHKQLSAINILGIMVTVFFLLFMALLYEFIQLADRHNKFNKSYENYIREEMNK